MKKIAFYSLLLASIGFTACDEDFNKGIASPQTNAQEVAAETIGFSATAITPINLESVTEDSVQVLNITAPTVSATSFTYYVALTADGATTATTLPVSASGKLAVTDLQNVITTAYNQRPTERTFTGVASVVALINGEAVRTSVSDLTFAITPKTEIVIEEKYYLSVQVGTSAADTIPFTHSTEDVYDDPVFTVTFPAPVDASNARLDAYVKIAPQSVVDGGSLEGTIGVATDGDTATEGTLVAENAQRIKLPASDGAKNYRITVDLKNMTYTIVALNFNSSIFVPGNHQSWAPASAGTLRLIDEKGIYEGFAYLDGGFKFTKENNWTGGDYGYASFTTFSNAAASFTNDGGNLSAPAGHYYLKVNLSTMELDAIAISQWGAIGSATPNGWNDPDTPLTYDDSTNSWVGTMALTAGELKFRANGEWKYDLNMGGTSLTDLVKNGANISWTDAGTYEIRLILHQYDGTLTSVGTYQVTLTKQN